MKYIITILLAVILGVLLNTSRTIVVQNNNYYIKTATITGYSSTEDQTDSTPFLTASQKQVKKGIIACPREIPFGSKVEIEGKAYICEDRMSKKFNDRFDIWFESTEEALEWGRQTKMVVVYK